MYIYLEVCELGLIWTFFFNFKHMGTVWLRLTYWFFVSDTGFLRTLDSSIKRNTAVIKKLKQINEEQREGLMEELRGVNLSKFVSEAVTAICDAKLRSTDIQAAVQVATCLISSLF